MKSIPSINSAFEKTWLDLEKHYQESHKININKLLNEETERLENFTQKFNGIYVDLSKNLCAQSSLNLLLSLAEASEIKLAINNLFSGKNLNTSENRPALHTALRTNSNKHYKIDDENIFSAIESELQHIEKFVEKIHAGELNGHSGKPIDTFINIGIGGSDLGPRLVVDALDSFKVSNINSYFVANIDHKELGQILDKVDPDTSLFCIASKSFTTMETLINANTAKKWLLENGCTDVTKHFIAISANSTETEKFGITPENYFRIWDWVGGRYSLWSAIGLPIAVSIGFKNFRELLAGATAMDVHFIESPLEKNIPVLLGLLDIWYINFLGTSTLAIVPYDETLKLLPVYLSQLVMESNGKNIDKEGEEIEYDTAPVIWGGVGTQSQHAFFQLLHQGTHLIPVEFLAPLKDVLFENGRHKMLLANCFAQSEALMTGNINDKQEINSYQRITGNRPSTMILYNGLDPHTLGSLLAMYEHRTFVQGHIWNINSFDQWGVELGKKLANTLTDELDGDQATTEHDKSTNKLIRCYKNKID